MRHLLGNIATQAIAGLLLVGAVGFAWIRSAQVTVSDEATELARFEPVAAHEFFWAEVGEASYRRNCQACHLADGKGWDQYPGLGHTSRLFTAPSGREYVLDLHLFGLTSERWRAPMPPMGHMPDVDLAAAINHVLTSFGNERHLPADAPFYVPADVATRRGLELSPAQVNARRPTVEEMPN